MRYVMRDYRVGPTLSGASNPAAAAFDFQVDDAAAGHVGSVLGSQGDGGLAGGHGDHAGRVGDQLADAIRQRQGCQGVGPGIAGPAKERLVAAAQDAVGDEHGKMLGAPVKDLALAAL